MKPAIYATVMTIETAIVVAIICYLATPIPHNWIGAAIIAACLFILLFAVWVLFLEIRKDRQ